MSEMLQKNYTEHKSKIGFGLTRKSPFFIHLRYKYFWIFVSITCMLFGCQKVKKTKQMQVSLIDTFSSSTSHPFNLKWHGHSYDAQQVQEALNQPYRYMNAGTQSIAFLSADEKYVIKFFKKKRFLPQEAKNTHIPFFTHWRTQRKTQKCEAKRDKIFSAYQTSCKRLSKETGVFYVHFNQSDHLHSLSLTDPLEKIFEVPLDDFDFVLERRAVPLSPYLHALLERGKIEEAGLAICQLLDLHRRFYQKGMRNRDIEFVNNYGFIDGKPVLFDVGRLFPCEGQEGKEKYQKKLSSFLPAFRNWIQVVYPQLISYCDEGIAKVMKTFFKEEEAFSLTRSHPYELQWEGHALDTDESKIVQEALSQSYQYLNRGSQCFAFISEDKKYVIKFFKQKIFSIPDAKKQLAFFTKWNKQRKLKQRAAKRNRMYFAYKLSWDNLSKETGILYVHLNSTDHLKKNLQLTDASAKNLSIELDDFDFILEWRAEGIQEHFDTLLAKGDVHRAGESLRRLLELYCVFYQKKVRDRDHSIVSNYGFHNGCPVLFDVGRLVACEGLKDKKKYKKSINRILSPFRAWVATHYPMLLPYCDTANAQILQTIYDEP